MHLQDPIQNASITKTEVSKELKKMFPNVFTIDEFEKGIEKFRLPDDDFMYGILFETFERGDGHFNKNEIMAEITTYFYLFKEIRRILLETDKQCFESAGKNVHLDKIDSIKKIFPKDLCYCRNGQVQTVKSFGWKEDLLKDCPLKTESCHSEKCDKGYYHQVYAPPKPHGVCKLKKCYCTNGKANEGIDCRVSGAYSCKIGSCNEGFYMTEESMNSKSPECILQPPNLLTFQTTGYGYKEKTIRAPSNNILSFKVAATKDAHILLQGFEKLLEIVIGSSGNQRTVIRSIKKAASLISRTTPNILNQSFQTFTISYNTQDLVIYKGDFQTEIIRFNNWKVFLPTVEGIDFCCGEAVTASWRVLVTGRYRI